MRLGLLVSGLFGLLVPCLSATPAGAEEALSFKDKTPVMLVGAAPGGGTDAVARLVAAHIGAWLPGHPTFVVRNMPGAGGVVALNSFVKQAKPDGLMLFTGSGTESDPLHYRAVNAIYDLSALRYLAGMGRTGTALLINKQAAPRLLDKSQPQVTMGALTAIRSGMQMALWGSEYFGWNMRWVMGYPSNAELVLALDREEFDMTSLSEVEKVRAFLASGRFQPLAQSGALIEGKLVPQAAFGDMPLLTDLLAGKVTDPVADKALAYWRTITLVGQWVALPPDTPEPIASLYRTAFGKMMQDQAFGQQAAKVEPDIIAMSGEDVLGLMKLLAGTPPEALAYMVGLQKKQGLHVAE
jgi:tripartite-type tricarboxylate transporter receptor subunit TctC